MKTEQPNADKRNAVDPILPDRTKDPKDTKEMTPDERLRFEKATRPSADAEAPVADDADRLTKSGRLNIREVRKVQSADVADG